MHIAAKSLAAGFALLAFTQAVDAQSYGFATYNAYVLASGVVSRSSGVTSSTAPSTGVYNITFSRDVNTCVFAASLNGITPGYVTATNKAGTTNVINVRTFNTSGAVFNQPFNLIVTCAS